MDGHGWTWVDAYGMGTNSKENVGLYLFSVVWKTQTSKRPKAWKCMAARADGQIKKNPQDAGSEVPSATVGALVIGRFSRRHLPPFLSRPRARPPSLLCLVPITRSTSLAQSPIPLIPTHQALTHLAACYIDVGRPEFGLLFE